MAEDKKDDCSVRADIFLSYAREDETRVQPLADVLAQHGWSVFWDRRIPAGKTWRSHIGQGLADAHCVIVAWSPHSIGSRWVTEEADDGQKRGILIPVLLDAVEPPIGFRSIQAADLTAWQPGRPSRRFEQLLDDVKSVLQGAQQPPTPAKTANPGIDRPSQPPQRPSRTMWRQMTIALAVVVLLAVAGVSIWVERKPETPPRPAQTGTDDGNGGASTGSGAAAPPYFMTRTVTEKDLQGKSDWELDVMRNEIYARHGRWFNRDDLQNHFDSQPWYAPKYSPAEFPIGMLTEEQRSNAVLIQNYKNSR